MSSTLLAMRGTSKRFANVLAKDRIDFTAKKGEIHALGGVRSVASFMQVRAGLPGDFMQVIQAFILLGLAAEPLLRWQWPGGRARRERT